ncbi:hypothetical protein DM860_011612 [Cuscuta australis]|uniref:Uncharacterized protein n=1 Tax=Cuscuta australis TaxID=267555 RepID=A0A328D0Z1_9ASTE|nr:hypothetical protein DM860_011612 [Cuscuta australis]
MSKVLFLPNLSYGSADVILRPAPASPNQGFVPNQTIQNPKIRIIGGSLGGFAVAFTEEVYANKFNAGLLSSRNSDISCRYALKCQIGNFQC